MQEGQGGTGRVGLLCDVSRAKASVSHGGTRRCMHLWGSSSVPAGCLSAGTCACAPPTRELGATALKTASR